MTTGESSDVELMTLVRDGKLGAYGTLYERHVAAAHNLARQLSHGCRAEAEDLVAEAFAKLFTSLKTGHGPDYAFRAYLLTALRRTAYDKTRRGKKEELTEDVSTVTGIKPETVSKPFIDTAIADLDRQLAVRAFQRLPQRWRTVLWHTEIQGQSPADVAPILGLSANAVAVLAYRARERLKQAYLQVHLAQTPDTGCQTTTKRLGAHIRAGLSTRATTQVETHLDKCAGCRTLAAELAEINGTLGRQCDSRQRARWYR